ncbi:DUF1707 SHOCT-like domain-containing protein [Nocardia blacklockiae]|uniref:DUF1707 SHOCT-like domain-containing protein n=1 Tax=Nocardia blacklockiae TaxID=480036 RepID=UPI0018955DB1|nr:DUF1707 domain-containing protein [Nocardia blacklockiae]MBF6175626.1 DUF1707 domain-containing protein [Nocardia blacklockiae]
MTEIPDSRLMAADRERALRELSAHLGSGRLSLAEFDERSTAAAAATTKAELAEVFLDLPIAAQAPAEHVAGVLPRLVTGTAAVLVFAVVCAWVTGNWWWLVLLAALPLIARVALRAR